MYAFVMLVLIASGVGVAVRVLGELHPALHAPSGLTLTFTALAAIGVCWALNYSVFTAFGQTVRADWLNPVGSGVLLVAAGELIGQVFKVAKAAARR